VKPGTINGDLIALRASLNFAVEARLLDKIPVKVKLVRAPKKRSFTCRVRNSVAHAIQFSILQGRTWALWKAAVPYTYEFNSATRIAYVRGSGPLDIDESLEAPLILSRQPGFRPDFGVIVDLRDLEYEPNAADVVVVGRNLIRLRHLFDHRVALVVRRKLNLAAELTAAIASAGGFPLRIFDSPDEAIAWARPPTTSTD